MWMMKAADEARTRNVPTPNTSLITTSWNRNASMMLRDTTKDDYVRIVFGGK